MRLSTFALVMTRFSVCMHGGRHVNPPRSPGMEVVFQSRGQAPSCSEGALTIGRMAARPAPSSSFWGRTRKSDVGRRIRLANAGEDTIGYGTVARRTGRVRRHGQRASQDHRPYSEGAPRRRLRLSPAPRLPDARPAWRSLLARL